MPTQEVKAQLVDIHQARIYPASIQISEGKIEAITPLADASNLNTQGYVMPGFIDAHVHVESSMLVPTEFARLAVVHGTVATISDPHEIANVLGIEGVEYMIENGQQVPFKFYFGAPSCVPATTFETAGASIDAQLVSELLARPEIKYLSEMMNYPGVIHQDPEIMAKLTAAKAVGKPIDGHAPGVSGTDLERYVAAGISTDHECTNLAEAKEKLALGMHILIREGSAAKNYAALIPLLPEYSDRVMFCSDDKHPDDLIAGHINQLVARSVALGIPLFDVLKVACINPIQHYQLEVGQLRVGDPADFIIVENLVDFIPEATYINGTLVATKGQSKIPSLPVPLLNHFNTTLKTVADFHCPAQSKHIQVIEALDGELLTNVKVFPATIEGENTVANIKDDVLKFAVVNRYQVSPPAIGFIHGFGLQTGALASCVGHDSHNILAIGTSDEALCAAVNAIIEHKGGIALITDDQVEVLPLPVAGIMSADRGEFVANRYATLDQLSKTTLGSKLTAPFMTLSFMGLLVIPRLKLSDLGLFDGAEFNFTPLFV